MLPVAFSVTLASRPRPSSTVFRQWSAGSRVTASWLVYRVRVTDPSA